MRRLTTFLLFTLATQWVLAQDQCSVREEESFGLVTGHFSVGPRIANLVVPRGVNAFAVPTIFVEAPSQTPSDSAGEYYFESGGERAPMRNGTEFRPHFQTNTRVTIALFREGMPEPLCTWTPRVRTNRRPATRALPFDPLDLVPIQRLGDPILALATGNQTLADDYTVDGMPMPVLLQAGSLVYLRDPAPSTGIRTIRSPRHAAPSLFVDVQVSPAKVEAATKYLTISVTGLEDLRRPINLALFNSHRERLRLNCGKDNRLFDEIKADGYENRNLLITPGDVRNGRFDMRCSIRVLQAGETGIWTHLLPDERGLHLGDGQRRF
jgi:hypothetical protein